MAGENEKNLWWRDNDANALTWRVVLVGGAVAGVCAIAWCAASTGNTEGKPISPAENSAVSDSWPNINWEEAYTDYPRLNEVTRKQIHWEIYEALGEAEQQIEYQRLKRQRDAAQSVSEINRLADKLEAIDDSYTEKVQRKYELVGLQKTQILCEGTLKNWPRRTLTD